jgi:hypothetical protein
LPSAAAATSRAVLAAEVVASRKLDDRVVVSSEILQYPVSVKDKSLKSKCGIEDLSRQLPKRYFVTTKEKD